MGEGIGKKGLFMLTIARIDNLLKFMKTLEYKKSHEKLEQSVKRRISLLKNEKCKGTSVKHNMVGYQVSHLQ